MKLRFCIICGTNKNLHHHHIIPVSKGGTDHQHNFITLCSEHHAMIHQLRPGTWNNHNELVRIGREKAKRDGIKFGRKRQYEHLIPDIKFMREVGWGYGTIARELSKSGDDISVSAIRRICEWEKIEKKKIAPGGIPRINPDIIVGYAKKGYGATKIAKIMNIHRDSIYRLVPNFSEVYRKHYKPPVVKEKEKKYRKLSSGQFVLL